MFYITDAELEKIKKEREALKMCGTKVSLDDWKGCWEYPTTYNASSLRVDVGALNGDHASYMKIDAGYDFNKSYTDKMQEELTKAINEQLMRQSFLTYVPDDTKIISANKNNKKYLIKI